MPTANICRPLASFLFFDHRNVLFVGESYLHVSVLLLGGLYTNLEEIQGLRSKPLIRDAAVRPLGMHALRHYAASLVIKEKGALVVREIMGHHSAAFTMKTYGGFIDDKARVMADVGDLFDGRMSEALAKTPQKRPEKVTQAIVTNTSLKNRGKSGNHGAK